MRRLTTTNSHLGGPKNPCKELSVEDFERLVRGMTTSNTARISAQVIARHSAKTLINVTTSCCLQRFLKVQTPNAATERCRKDHYVSDGKDCCSSRRVTQALYCKVHCYDDDSCEGCDEQCVRRPITKLAEDCLNFLYGITLLTVPPERNVMAFQNLETLAQINCQEIVTWLPVGTIPSKQRNMSEFCMNGEKKTAKFHFGHKLKETLQNHRNGKNSHIFC